MHDPHAASAGDGQDVDPQIRVFMQRMAAGYAAFPDLAGASLDEVRRVTAHVRAQWTQGGPEMASRADLRVGPGGLRVRVLRPSGDADLPALIYLHGGGWTLFSIDTHDRLMREYAARAGVAVVAVDYSLSPEAKYPRALAETLEVIDWLRGSAAEHGIDPARIAIGGDSAGANLALTSQLSLLARGEAPLSAMLLNYGVYTDAPSPSWSRYDGPAYMLGTGEMQEFWTHYLADPAQRADPLVMPLLADLRGLPPAFLAIAECDVLADGNRAMAQALRGAGVAVDERVYAGATHSFLEAVSVSGLADGALDDATTWLRTTLARA